METETSKRMTVRVSREAWEALASRASSDGITMSDRVGAMVDLWMSDPTYQERIEPRARELAIEHRSRRYLPRTKTD